MPEWKDVFSDEHHYEELLVNVFTYKNVKNIERTLAAREWRLEVMEYGCDGPVLFQVVNKNKEPLRTQINRIDVLNSVLDLDNRQRNLELRDAPDFDPAVNKPGRRVRFTDIGEPNGEETK